MKPFFVAVMLSIAAAAPAQTAAQERPQDRWNLGDLYASTDAWDADAARVESELPQLAACKGHLGDAAKRLKDCFDLQHDIYKRYLRLAVYANELHAEDTGNSASLGLRQKTQVLGSKLSEATSYIHPEILALGKPRIDQFLREEPGLAVYRHD